MRTSDFDYPLPANLIAQTPAPQRDGSRLLVLDRATRTISHRRFLDLPEFLRAGDLLVLNNSRVIPARFRAKKSPTGSSVEILLVEEVSANDWWVLLRPGKRVRAETALELPGGVRAVVRDKNEEGHYRLIFTGTDDILQSAELFGEVPLPPYIERTEAPGTLDRERYQTVFAGPKGSVAAPSAGLHFTEAMLEALHHSGVESTTVTLHVGLGTFAPVKAESLQEHKMHSERFNLGADAAAKIRQTKARGGRVVAVGTTSLRVVESVSILEPSSGRTQLFVFPPYQFRVVDCLLTNFHLPQSTLLMLVSAFASPGKTNGREWILEAYAEAIREGYRFFSYGDAMLIL